MKHLGDITKISGYDVPPVDVITGGSPCQDLSVAGKRAGLGGERSGLFLEQIRIVKEMRERDRLEGRPDKLCRPRFMVWENVPGAFSSNFRDGYGDFGAVLEEIICIAEPTFSLPRLKGGEKWTKSGAIDGDGWSIAWRTHDAQYWGVPQRRRRISLVADFGGECAGEILFERKGLSGNTEQGKPQRKETACDTAKRIGEHDTVAIEGNGQRESHKGDGYKLTDKMYTLNTVEVHSIAFDAYQHYGYRENESLGVLTTGAGCVRGDTPLVCDKVFTLDCRNAAVNEEISGTIQAKDNGGFSYNCINPIAYTLKVRGGVDVDSKGRKAGKGALVQTDISGTIGVTQDQTLFHPQCYGICSYGSNSMKSSNPDSGIYKAETSRTLDLSGGNPACNQGGIAVCEAVPMTMQSMGEYKQCQVASSCKERDYKSATDLIIEPVNYAEKRFFDWEQDDVSVTLRNKGGSYGNGSEVLRVEPICIEMTSTKNTVVEDGIMPTLTARMGTGGNQVNAVLQWLVRWIVRRLTPKECERLQGFPDDWTNIGEWIDSKGKKHKEADTPRYKALGNSIALPFWQWMAERICAQYDHEVTMASLFDGIGGFPLVFERCGAKAVWASEIEEFPMAVTKARFGE